MADVAALPPKQALQAAAPRPLEMDDRGVYIVHNQSDEVRVARMLMQSGAVNSSLRNEVHVMVAMQAAKSVGLNPMTALRQIGYINGSLVFYGDLELAVVRMSGVLESFEEFLFCQDKDGKYLRRSYSNNNLHLPAFGAVCLAKRKDGQPCEEGFTIDDAKAAGLWQKTPTWRNYPGRMMQMRARGLMLRNIASDVLQGIDGMEYGHEGVDRS
ncbi:MAG: hypothetical protein EOO40_01200 [Deltaproteobacteria bacterium]|nr:MAG: hypothetical protein EOO40_01200 [Deltaproteobacteria bacterium]